MSPPTIEDRNRSGTPGSASLSNHVIVNENQEHPTYGSPTISEPPRGRSTGRPEIAASASGPSAYPNTLRQRFGSSTSQMLQGRAVPEFEPFEMEPVETGLTSPILAAWSSSDPTHGRNNQW